MNQFTIVLGFCFLTTSCVPSEDGLSSSESDPGKGFLDEQATQAARQELLGALQSPCVNPNYCADESSYPAMVATLGESGSGYYCKPWAMRRTAALLCNSCDCGGPSSYIGALPGSWSVRALGSLQVGDLVFITDGSREHWGTIRSVSDGAPVTVDHFNCDDNGQTVLSGSYTSFWGCVGGSGRATFYHLNQCSECTPSCSGKECGSDGCGGSCGTCGVGYECSAGRCVGATFQANSCTSADLMSSSAPKTCSAYCARFGATCSNTCTTNRGYTNWGVEAWYTEEECQAYSTSGGQHSCTTDLSIFSNPSMKKYRCCCSGGAVP